MNMSKKNMNVRERNNFWPQTSDARIHAIMRTLRAASVGIPVAVKTPSWS